MGPQDSIFCLCTYLKTSTVGSFLDYFQANDTGCFKEVMFTNFISEIPNYLGSVKPQLKKNQRPIGYLFMHKKSSRYFQAGIVLSYIYPMIRQ